MNWKTKARIMRICATLPIGDQLYRFGQKHFGRLNADPMSRIRPQLEIARWILERGNTIEGKDFFEVGTGHKPIVPIGFFLVGAKLVTTVDLNRRIDWRLTKRALLWIAENSDKVRCLYLSHKIVDPALLDKRLALIRRLWATPRTFLREANIHYWAPADAASTGLPAGSIDYHFSANTLEHIPYNTIKDIFIEANRILTDVGVGIHFVDLSDHFQHQDKSIRAINFLRFTEAEWERIAGNEFAYCNRLRASNYLALFKELSFDVLRLETSMDDEAKSSLRQGFPLDEGFKSYGLGDICTTGLRIMLGHRGEA